MKWIVYVLVAFVLPFSLFAQTKEFRSFSLEEGLPQSDVQAILQDNLGYLWMGTQGGGLCRFDGQYFKVWNSADGLASNYIHALHANNDKLYIGTKQGLSIKSKIGFENIILPQVNKIITFSGIQYVATEEGLYRYQNENGLKKLRLHPEIDAARIRDILFDGTRYWVATHRGLWELDALGSTATILKKRAINNFVSLAFHDEVLFAATYDDGILVVDPKTVKPYELLIREPVRITAIRILGNTELWVATDNNGFTVIDTETYNDLKTITRSNGRKLGHVHEIISDRQSNIWIATGGNGLLKYFQNTFQHLDEKAGLSEKRIHATHSTKDGVWIGNSAGKIHHLTAKGIQTVVMDKRLSEVVPKTIASTPKGALWIGTDGGGLYYRGAEQRISEYQDEDNTTFKVRLQELDTLTKKGRYLQVLDQDRGLVSDWIRSVVVQKETLWVATYDQGIQKLRYYPEKDSLVRTKIFDETNGMNDIKILDFKAGPNGKLWYTTQNGEVGFVENNKLTNLGQVLAKKVAIGTILFQKNRIYLGTKGVGIWFSALTKPLLFKQLNGKKQLYSNNINQLIFDDKEFLWSGNEQGVDKIILNKEHTIQDVFHFGRNDGFLGIETTSNTAVKDFDGTLWFGAVNGLSCYSGASVTKENAKPSIAFEDIQVGYTSLDSLNLQSWTNSSKILTLQPQENQVTFVYKMIDLDHPNEVEYRYRLNASDWSPWSTDHKQNLAGLSYGKHLFSAQSRNARWEESDPIHFKLFIDSPLYKKTWFLWSLLGVVAFLLIVFSVRYVRKIKKKNKIAQEGLELKNHLLSLEHRALQLQMNPHFIFNVLNGIKGMGSKDTKKMNNTINTFAVMLRETLNNSRKDTITLSQEIKTLKHYIGLEQLMASKEFTYHLVLDTDMDPEEILIPPMLIQPFVENAIRHGILKGRRKGVLTIGFKTTEEILQCTVTDNGVGIFQSQKMKAKTDHQSMALKVTQERLTSISGSDSLDIKELKDSTNKVLGTQIEFKIPLQTDY